MSARCNVCWAYEAPSPNFLLILNYLLGDICFDGCGYAEGQYQERAVMSVQDGQVGMYLRGKNGCMTTCIFSRNINGLFGRSCPPLVAGIVPFRSECCKHLQPEHARKIRLPSTSTVQALLILVQRARLIDFELVSC